VRKSESKRKGSKNLLSLEIFTLKITLHHGKQKKVIDDDHVSALSSLDGISPEYQSQFK
jgi:hypothetical protein